MIWPEPIPESQRSIDDNWACISYATTHAIESQIKVQTGKTVNISARFLAIMSGTIPGIGNSFVKVFETALQRGWLDAADCPEPPMFTDAEYYGFNITPELLNKALKNKEDWDIDYTSNATLADLIKAPLIAWVPQYTANHAVEVLDPFTRFDTYIPYRRPLGPYQKLYQFLIKKKDNMKLINDNGTYYLEGNKGYFGINKVEFLNLLIKITDQVENRKPVGISQGIIETIADAFRIK